MDAMLLRPGDLVQIDPGRVERVYAASHVGPWRTIVIHTDGRDVVRAAPFDVQLEMRIAS